MSFQQIANLAQIVASIGVVVSLIFVGLQIRQNTRALERAEHNSTMGQLTVIRQAIAQNRDIAELMTAGSGRRTRLRCGRSAQTGTDAGRTGVGCLSDLGQNAARYFSSTHFRSHRWS